MTNRVVDPKALRVARQVLDECAACGAPRDSLHHIIQRGGPHYGDDVMENLVGICGSGTTGCHGAFHGMPYTVELRSFGRTIDSIRIDAEWVGREIGLHLQRERPDVIEYVLSKLGQEPGRYHLERFYSLTVP